MTKRTQSVLVLAAVTVMAAGACGSQSAPTATSGLETTTTTATTTTGLTATSGAATGATVAAPPSPVPASTGPSTRPATTAAAATTARSAASVRPTATTSTLAAPTTTAGATVAEHAQGPPSYGFSPMTFSVPAGSKVVVTNDSGTAPHTWSADDGSFDTGNIAPNATAPAITLTKKGTYGFYCKIHGATLMHGTLTVT